MSSLRKHNRLAAMERAQAAAVALCIEHGFAAVTVEEIARAAAISPATLYRYFGTKEAMVLWDGSADTIAAEISALGKSRLRMASLRDAIRRHARDDASTLARYRLIHATPALVAAAWITLIEDHAELAGAFGGTLEAEVLASAALGAIEVAYDHWQHANRVGALDNLLVRAFAPLIRLRV